MVVKDLYCWTDIDNTKQYLRFAVYNPTDKPYRIRVAHGMGLAKPGELMTSDRLEIPVSATCTYGMSLRKEDESNDHLNENVEVEVEGIKVTAPVIESQVLVSRYFDDLATSNVEALQSYLDSSIDIRQIASYIAWRRSIKPIQIQADTCTLSCQATESPNPVFRAESWRCDVSAVLVVYSSSSGSATWKGIVELDYLAGTMKLTPRRS